MSGACIFKGKNTIRGNYLNIELTGASDLELIAEVGLLSVDATGASSIKLAGSTDKMTVDLTGASEVSAYPLKAKNASIEMSGASSGNFTVYETLSIELSGASDVNLKGSPEVKYKEVSGAAEFSMN